MPRGHSPDHMQLRSMLHAILGMLLAIALGAASSVAAQEAPQRYTISGNIEDTESGESLIGATIWAPHQANGTATNRYGFYSMTVNADTVTLVFSYVGYGSRAMYLTLDGDMRVDVELTESVVGLEGVEIVATEGESHVEQTQMSRIELPVAQIQTLPALLGETDVLKAIQLLPGVQSGTEGTSGLYVRGGGPDQNLILLDGTPVYNASHLFGFMSVFNGDAIKKVELFKAGFPARYGGRLSSVIDLSMKEGNLKKFEGHAAIGIVSSRATVEGPIIKDRASFLISGRRTYVDLLARPFMKRNEKVGYYFYDLNAKANYILTDQDRIYVSVYQGRDKGGGEYGEENWSSRDALDWGNLTATARWNRIIGSNMFVNVLLGYTRYNINVESEVTDRASYSGTTYVSKHRANFRSGIRDGSARVSFEYTPSSSHHIRFGASAVAHEFQTGALTERLEETGSAPIDTVYTPDSKIRANEYSVYAEDDIRLSSRLKTNLGVHASAFMVNGERYASVQPRVSLWFGLSSQTSLKASAVAMQQYLHLLTTSNGISLPTDLWVPATERIGPQQAQQVAIGMAHSMGQGQYELSVESFYKQMSRLIEYKDGAGFSGLASERWEDKVTTGRGWSYGVELFLQKKTGRMTGWVGYTLSRSQRRFAELNRGRAFPYTYDRRHDVSAVVSYRWRQHVEVSATWVFGTGQAIWLPEGRVSGLRHTTGIETRWSRARRVTVRAYGARNSSRMQPYHRLDIGVHFHRVRNWGKQTLTVGAYNAYNRKNPFFLISVEDQSSGTLRFKKITVFPVLPAISYQIQF